jgi:hypothetical protein
MQFLLLLVLFSLFSISSLFSFFLLFFDSLFVFAVFKICFVAKAVTFSGLLNALDGIASGEGRILFMTTNRILYLSLYLFSYLYVSLYISKSISISRLSLRALRFLWFFGFRNSFLWIEPYPNKAGTSGSQSKIRLRHHLSSSRMRFFFPPVMRFLWFYSFFKFIFGNFR